MSPPPDAASERTPPWVVPRAAANATCECSVQMRAAIGSIGTRTGSARVGIKVAA